MTSTAPALDLSSILDDPLDFRFKSFPRTAGATVGTVGLQGWNALCGDLYLPVMVLKEAALQHNIEIMAQYCAGHGVSLAPHAKTPISPQIVERQLRAGAWGVTTANLHQTRIFQHVGVQRMILANEVVSEPELRWISAHLDADPDLWLACLVDSGRAADLMSAALAEIGPARQIPVLVELGVPGGRTGVRTVDDGLAVAEAINRSPYLELVGVEGYEGAVGGEGTEDVLANIDAYVQSLRRLTESLGELGLFAQGEEVIVSAGGSKFFDRVVAGLTRPWTLPVRVVLRSGAYVGHDVDSYEALSALGARGSGPLRLQPAMELWATILSHPEPQLAIAGFGKRDASYDVGLPVPLWRKRGSSLDCIQGAARVVSLNDQHAFVHLEEGADLEVGDLLGCGISHPCTAFERWKLLPLVDDEYTVTGAIETFF